VPLIVWGPDDLDTEPDQVGLKGSPTVVTGLREAEVRERRRQRLEGPIDDVVHQLIEILDPYLRTP
jgi:hypothetical protein